MQGPSVTVQDLDPSSLSSLVRYSRGISVIPVASMASWSTWIKESAVVFPKPITSDNTPLVR